MSSSVFIRLKLIAIQLFILANVKYLVTKEAKDLKNASCKCYYTPTADTEQPSTSLYYIITNSCRVRTKLLRSYSNSIRQIVPN